MLSLLYINIFLKKKSSKRDTINSRGHNGHEIIFTMLTEKDNNPYAI